MSSYPYEYRMIEAPRTLSEVVNQSVSHGGRGAMEHVKHVPWSVDSSTPEFSAAMDG